MWDFGCRQKSRFFFALLITLHAALVVTAAVNVHSKPAKGGHDKESVVAHSSRRVKNLDHWDAPTLAHYVGLDLETCSPLPPRSSSPAGTNAMVDDYAGLDAVILFYASWCPNCLALAPLYDQIATMLKAGTKSSNIIMALFDCEADVKNQDICTAAGVTHYPTLMFVGRDTLHQSPTSKERKLYKKGKVPVKLRRTVKFRGNWQYGEQIMDWIRFNHRWSSWKSISYDHPLVRFIRNAFTLPWLRRSLNRNPSRNALASSSKVDESLPVGVPVSASSSAATGFGGTPKSTGGAALSSEQQLLLLKTEAELDKKTKLSKEMEKAATNINLLLDSLLLPTSVNTSSSSAANQTSAYKDVFQNALANDVYARVKKDPTDDDALILRSCLADLSVDYCNRVMVHLVNDADFLDSLEKEYGKNKQVTVDDVEKSILQERNKVEPFCSILDDCLESDFAAEMCQPAKCPFQNELACRYVSTCLDQQVYTVYANELKSTSKKENKSNAGEVGLGGMKPAFL